MKKLTLLFILLSSFCFINSQQVKKVAVFDPEGRVMESIRHIFREEISNAIVNNPDYDVVERSMIEKVLQESRFQAGGLVDDTEISELGRMMGADYVCYGTIQAIGENYYMSLKMVEVVTARVIAQRTSTTREGLNDLITVTASLANQLISITERDKVVTYEPEPKIEIQEERPVVREVEPVREVRPAEPDYKGRYFMLGVGAGRSYGYLGLRAQFRLGGNFGFGMHAGVGAHPNDGQFMASGGLKLFPYRGFYINVQFGIFDVKERYYWDSWYSSWTYENVIGPSVMVGGDWVWGRKVGFGFNAALGVSFDVNASDYYSEQPVYPAIDLGFIIRF